MDTELVEERIERNEAFKSLSYEDLVVFGDIETTEQGFCGGGSDSHGSGESVDRPRSRDSSEQNLRLRPMPIRLT